MKYYLLICSIIVSLQAMEKETAPEWSIENALEYQKNNKVQEETACKFLQWSTINLSGKYVLDAGCGTGNITEKLATEKEAKQVDGIDASQAMIELAKKTYPHVPNIHFKHCRAEELDVKNSYDIVVAFHAIHWFQDKPKAFKNFHACLKEQGEFFGTIITDTDAKDTVTLKVFQNMVPGLPLIHSFLDTIGFSSAIGSSYPTDDEYKDMIQNAGFTIISFEPQHVEVALETRNDVMNHMRPIVMSRPLAHMIPSTLSDMLFNRYIENIIRELKTNEEGHFLCPVDTTLVHAVKK